MSNGLLNNKMWGAIPGTTITTPKSALTKCMKAKSSVYKRYAYVPDPRGATLSPDDIKEILLRKNGKVVEYTHTGSFPSVSGSTIHYDKGSLIETTLEHCIENINKGTSGFEWMNAITIDVLAKQANIHPVVLVAIIMAEYSDTRIDLLIRGVIKP